MNRRSLLALVGAGSLTAFMGCLEGTETPADEEEAASPSDGSTEGTGSTSTDSVEDTDTANPENTDLDEQSCPPYETQRDRAVCSHTVNTDTATVYLDADPNKSGLTDGKPDGEITLTLHNQSSSDLTFNPNSWEIGFNRGSEWEEFQRQKSGDGDVTVPADETHSWSLMDAVESIQDNPDLEPGVYAAELGVPDPETSDEWIACIALVQLNSSE